MSFSMEHGTHVTTSTVHSTYDTCMGATATPIIVINVYEEQSEVSDGKRSETARRRVRRKKNETNRRPIA